MLRGSPALGRSHASFAAEHGGEIIAVGEPAFEGDLADGKSGMQPEQDLGFLQTLARELFAESRMQFFPEHAAQIIRIDAEQVGQVGQSDIFLIMSADERQTILHVEVFIAAFDAVHSSPERDGTEFHFERPAQEKRASAQFRAPVFFSCAGQFSLKEIRRPADGPQ